jgi:hypothetical protein
MYYPDHLSYKVVGLSREDEDDQDLSIRLVHGLTAGVAVFRWQGRVEDSANFTAPGQHLGDLLDYGWAGGRARNCQHR